MQIKSHAFIAGQIGLIPSSLEFPLPETSPKNARKMYKLIPNSKIEFIEGAGHFPHLENPKMFLYFVKDFASP